MATKTLYGIRPPLQSYYYKHVYADATKRFTSKTNLQTTFSHVYRTFSYNTLNTIYPNTILYGIVFSMLTDAKWLTVATLDI